MHNMDANKTHCEKSRWELHKNTTSYFEQIQEATNYEVTILRLLPSYLKNNLSNMQDTAGEARKNS